MTREDDYSGPNSALEVHLDLPEDSLFTANDYAQMYRVATSEDGKTILGQLRKEGPLSECDLQSQAGDNADEFQAVLKRLQRAALITQRESPDLEEESSGPTYSITRLGEVVLRHGPEPGISRPATEEECIKEAYRNRDTDRD